MRSMKRQGGSVAGFVVIGTILVLVSFGALYGMKHIAMRDQTPPMILPGLASNDSGESDTGRGDASDDKVADDKPAEDGSSQPEEQSVDNSPADQTENKPKPSEPQTVPQSGSSGSNLPQSGPSEDIISLIALSAVTTSGVAYIRSFRRY